MRLTRRAKDDVDFLTGELGITPGEAVELAVSWYRRIGLGMVLRMGLRTDAPIVGDGPVDDDGYDPDYDNPDSGFYRAHPECR